MQVSVALEQRFQRLPDGTVWTQSCFRRGFWQRYLAVFERVQCIARVQDAATLQGDWHRADGDGVAFCAVPHFIGPWQFVRKFHAARRVVVESVGPGGAVILRVPGTIGDLTSKRLAALSYPFGVEVIGDPRDVFARGAVRHPLRPYLRWRATRNLRRQCQRACSASYVTERVLQHRYPSPGPTVGASSIELHADAFAAAPRAHGERGRAAHLVFVGSLEQVLQGA